MAKHNLKPTPAPVAAPADTGSFKPNLDFVKAVHEGMQSDQGFIYASTEFLHDYVAAGLVEMNPAMKNAAGDVATRLSPAGMALIGGEGETAVSDTPIANAASFEIDTDVEFEPRGKRNRESKYPFADLPAPVPGRPPASFHVPVNDENKTPKELLKNFASNVGAANMRYSVETGETERVQESTYEVGDDGRRVKRDGHYVKTGTQMVDKPIMRRERQFEIRIAAPNDPKGPGVRVFRTI